MWDGVGGFSTEPQGYHPVPNPNGYYQANPYPDGRDNRLRPPPMQMPSPGPAFHAANTFVPSPSAYSPLGPPVSAPPMNNASLSVPPAGFREQQQRAGGRRHSSSTHVQMQTSTSHQHVRHSHSHNHLAAAQRPQVYQVVASAPAVPHRTEHRHEHASSKPSKPVKVTHAPASQPVNLSDFAYSKCTGRKKALCIGINYTGTRQELRGCVNDAKNVMRFLHRNYGFKQEDIVILTDDRSDPRARPTKANMVDAMKWLVSGARPNDSLFFHYSGHGGQVKDRDGDEPDGKDEVIYPLDYRTAGPIIDDEMHAIMVRSLPRGCRLTALFDSCHSGSALDLPYSYHSDGRIKSMGVTDRARQRKHTAADVISWSGCKDSQTSADVASTDGRLAVGAMSDAFMASLSRNPRQSYAGLLKSVRDILKKKYSQKPQLSSSHKIDTTLMFVM